MSWNQDEGDNQRKNPWGNAPEGEGGGWKGRNDQGPPDFEDIIRRFQKRVRGFFPGGGIGGVAIFFLILLAFVVWLFTGFYRVQPGEQGVALFLGRPVALTGPGLNYNWPYPIGVVYTPNTSELREVTIGLRQLLQFTRGKNALEEVDVPEESLMLTGDENIIDIDFKVQWQIQNPENYLFNIQDPEGTVKSVSESAMREVVGRRSIDSVLNDRAPVQAAVQKLIQSILDSYRSGVRITQVQMQKVDPPEAVIGAFRDVQAAKADLERIQNVAQAYANRVVPEARGEAARILESARAYRDQTVAQAEGQADRFVKIYDQYKLNPELTRERIYLETLEKILPNTDKILMDRSVLKGGILPFLPLTDGSTPSGKSSSSPLFQNIR